MARNHPAPIYLSIIIILIKEKGNDYRYTGSWCGEDVTATQSRIVFRHGVNKDEQESYGDDVSPSELPVDAQFDSQHEIHIANESV